MLLRGNKVLLVEDDDVGQIVFPDECWLLQDKTGRRFRKCDILIVYCDETGQSVSESLPQDRDEAENYWGKHTRFRMYHPHIPDGPWKFVANVVRIGYRRGRKGMHLHPGPNEAPLRDPVKLYESTGRTKGWRLRLPSDCVVDDRGFVYP